MHGTAYQPHIFLKLEIIRFEIVIICVEENICKVGFVVIVVIWWIICENFKRKYLFRFFFYEKKKNNWKKSKGKIFILLCES